MPAGKRGLWFAAACLLALMVMAGCSKEQAGSNSSSGGGNAAGGKKKIVFVFKIGGISYSEACKEGAEQANTDPKINADVEYEASSEGTSEKQADIINQQIVGHADAIVVSPVDAKAIVPSIKKAADQNVKPYTWDSDAPDSKRIFYVAAVDDVQIGVDVGDALAKSIGGKGKVLIFSGQRTAENLNKHVQGIEQALKKYPGITIVQPYIYNNDDKATATSMAYQALQAHPDVTGIACSNSVSPPAAGEAIRKLHLIGKVNVWGLGLPSENKTYLQDGSVTGLYLWDPKELTYLTAMLVKNDLDGHPPQNGQEIPNVGKITVNGPLVTLPLRLRITKENVDQLNF
ncbi:MAG TPA: autoinducer 2 ABC transporter substrate-binding protein [Chthonomonadaceae bacterium]|nr:autoinducer 2 ABC transporter substrate-binding protein [Chthonomonadaceae bacterium]